MKEIATFNSFDVSDITQVNAVISYLKKSIPVQLLEVNKIKRDVEPKFTFTGTADEQGTDGIIISSFKKFDGNLIVIE